VVDPEELLALNPRVAIAWPAAAQNLAFTGVPLVPLRPTPGNEFFPEMWREVATVAGRGSRDRAIEAAYRTALAELSDELSRTTGEPRPSAVFLWQVTPGLFRLAAGQHAVALEFAALGAINGSRALPLSGRGQNVEIDVERLMELNPDVIVLSCCSGIALNPGDLFDRPEFRSLSAVRTRRVYRQPVGGARMEGLVEAPLLARWLAELLYPEQLAPRFRDRCAVMKSLRTSKCRPGGPMRRCRTSMIYVDGTVTRRALESTRRDRMSSGYGSTGMCR
jgi:ABC-type Fe3+-hydroxamate transport system substrate-binding protein